MEAIGSLLSGMGWIISIIAGLWILVEAFKTSLLWFIGCLFPFVGLIWVILHWQEGKAPFFLALGGIGLRVLGGVIMAM